MLIRVSVVIVQYHEVLWEETEPALEAAEKDRFAAKRDSEGNWQLGKGDMNMSACDGARSWLYLGLVRKHFSVCDPYLVCKWARNIADFPCQFEDGCGRR